MLIALRLLCIFSTSTSFKLVEARGTIFLFKLLTNSKSCLLGGLNRADKLLGINSLFFNGSFSRDFIQPAILEIFKYIIVLINVSFFLTVRRYKVFVTGKGQSQTCKSANRSKSDAGTFVSPKEGQ